jgi:HlyD family secretion protein
MNAFVRRFAPQLGRREAGVATAGVLGLALLTAGVGWMRSVPTWPTALVRAEAFTEMLVEAGTITTQQMTLYASTLPAGQSKILELAPEGTLVREGDLLVRLDTSQFEQALERDRAELRRAEAELTRAVGDARLELLRAQDEFDAARQQVANAERTLANQIDGAGQVAVIEADATLAEATRELERAQKNVDDLKPLLAEQFITRAEFQRAEQALSRALDQRRLAAARRDSLVQYERPAATTRAQADVSLARETLNRQVESTVSRASQRQASLSAARSRVEEVRARIDMLTDQIARSTIRASGTGLVVYREVFVGDEKRKPQIGDDAFPGQPIIALPDTSQLLVETRIREVDLHKMTARGRVHVRVEAYPELELEGSVALVGALAQADATRAGTKFFPVTVKLTSTDSRLRTGMTARVEIEVASLKSALVVPAQAVFDEDGQPYVVLFRNGRPERQSVHVAAVNESAAAIDTGVAEGDTVLLVDATTAPSSQ